MTDHLFIIALSVFLAGADGFVRLSAIEGDFVTLHINPDEIQKAADLLWIFNDEETFIAKIDRETRQTSIPGNDYNRFRNRLQVDDQTGSLNVTDVGNKDSGLYKLQISSRSGISHKRFNVVVTETSQTLPWIKAAVFFLLFGNILMFTYIISTAREVIRCVFNV